MKIAFFCSARENIQQTYENQVLEFLEKLDKEFTTFTHVVYGGGNMGLMGTVYNFFKGKKIIESHNLEKWRFEENPDENLYTSILKRQKMLLLSSDIYIILPGGVGTLSEFFDSVVLNEVEGKKKPIIIFNCNNYYDKLVELIADLISKGSCYNHDFLFVSSNPDEIVSELKNL
jgi:uncharacterized protein (TIGR00730 family)